MKKLTEVIFEKMLERRKTDHAVSEWTGVSRDTLSNWRKNGCKAIERFRDILDFLGYDIIIREKERK